MNRSGERTPLSRAEMAGMLERLARAEGRAGLELGVLFTDDRDMAGLNRRYRGVAGSTDVLSFPAGAPQFPGETPRLGDLVIALPTCRRQAARLGHARARELAFLLLHGFLHLCGYDHAPDRACGDRWRQAELRLGRLCEPLLPAGWRQRALPAPARRIPKSRPSTHG